jgi:hypothetical protein
VPRWNSTTREERVYMSNNSLFHVCDLDYFRSTRLGLKLRKIGAYSLSGCMVCWSGNWNDTSHLSHLGKSIKMKLTQKGAEPSKSQRKVCRYVKTSSNSRSNHIWSYPWAFHLCRPINTPLCLNLIALGVSYFQLKEQRKSWRERESVREIQTDAK